MKIINDIYLNYIEDFKIVLIFIDKHLGNQNILVRKNSGGIPSREMNIKNSQIKSYGFHGSGCEFVLRDRSFDVEFNQDIIGFTDWSFYTYCNRINSGITENIAKQYLIKMVNDGQLKFDGVVYSAW